LLRHEVRRALSFGDGGRLARDVAAAPPLGKCLASGEGGLVAGWPSMILDFLTVRR
jgi:hypothetical protein